MHSRNTFNKIKFGGYLYSFNSDNGGRFNSPNGGYVVTNGANGTGGWYFKNNEERARFERDRANSFYWTNYLKLSAQISSMGTGAAYSAYNNMFSGSYGAYIGPYIGNLFNDFETYLGTPLGKSYQNALNQTEQPNHYHPWDPMPDFAAPMISTINSMIYNGGTVDGFSMTSGGIVSFDYTNLGITGGYSDWQNPLSGEIIQETIFTVAVAHTASLGLSYYGDITTPTHGGMGSNIDWGTVGNAAFYAEQGLDVVGWAASSSANSGFQYAYKGMAQAEATAAKSLGSIAKGARVLGAGAAFVGGGAAVLQFAYSDKGVADYARLGGAAIITGTAFIPLVGVPLSIGLGILDSYGAFDGIYNSFGP